MQRRLKKTQLCPCGCIFMDTECISGMNQTYIYYFCWIELIMEGPSSMSTSWNVESMCEVQMHHGLHDNHRSFWIHLNWGDLSEGEMISLLVRNKNIPKLKFLEEVWCWLGKNGRRCRHDVDTKIVEMPWVKTNEVNCVRCIHLYSWHRSTGLINMWFHCREIR